MSKLDITNRDTGFDFAKGMLIIGVVWGHVITALQNNASVTPWIHVFLRTYDMPMFAFITGFFLYQSIQNHTLKYNVLNKIFTILYPTVIWCLILEISRQGGVSFTGLWFLWAIFISSIIVLVVDHIQNEYIKICLFVIAVIITHFGLGDRWNVGFLLFPTICGYYYHKTGVGRFFQQDVIPYIAFMIFVVLECFWTTGYNVWNAGCNILRLDYIKLIAVPYRAGIGLIGSIVMLNVFKMIHGHLEQSTNKLSIWLCNWIGQLGKITLELYILQSFFVSWYGGALVRIICRKLSFNPFMLNLNFMNMFIAPIISLFTLYIMQQLVSLVNRIPVIGRCVFRLPIKLNDSKAELYS